MKRVAPLIALLVAIGTGVYVVQRSLSQARRDLLVNELVESEELILHLTRRLGAMSRAIKNLSFPGRIAGSLFADEVIFTDLDPQPRPSQSEIFETIGGQRRSWPVAGEQTLPRDELALLAPLFAELQWLTRAKVYFVAGDLIGPEHGTFETKMGLAARGRTVAGQSMTISGKLHVTWKPFGAPDADGERDWRVVRWQLEQLSTDEGPTLFTEVLDETLPNATDRLWARRSIHEEYVAQGLKLGHIKPRVRNDRYGRSFARTALGQHPGLAVVDIDQDGFDDLYVMVRWGKNLMLRNQGDGTFVDVAGPMGLRMKSRAPTKSDEETEPVSTAAAFADFDNDGDLDLMLARTLERSAYLVNENGRFVDRTKKLVDARMPYFATSVCAADYNGDGLLDVYFSTYAVPGRDMRPGAEGSDPFLTYEEKIELTSRIVAAPLTYTNAHGPPNLLLLNKGGGKLAVAPENAQTQSWRNTFQSTWADYDLDGDPDLYVCSDYGADELYRNDGPKGFVNVATEVSGGAMDGFGMGAAWGDYNNDGAQDLYVSNMYSKAGVRVTNKVRRYGLDVRISRFAEGNLLLKSSGGQLERVSGLEAPDVLVAKAGWSWGCQFVDVDNDSNLDIYVGSGYYTLPEDVETEQDL